jgi:8-oxo-dGTP pyrophosphatase MutT (NUDIX family)
MIKIFTPENTIYLTDNQLLHKKGIKIINIETVDEMQIKYRETVHNSSLKREIYFHNANLKTLFEYFSSMFQVIEAAGGLVENEKGEYLFIFRNGKWDLPKGKIEKGEKIKDAAIREVEEECGIRDIKISEELPVTYHTYVLKEKNILKRTYWYKMKSAFNGKLVPQLEEGITDVLWVNANDIAPLLDNTYESIKEVLSTILPTRS